MAWDEVPGATNVFTTITRSPFAKLEVASSEFKLM